MARRRGRREGTIRRRKDGRYEVRVFVEWRDGKPVRRSYYGATREAVREELRKAQEKLAKGESLHEDRTTVGEYLDAWLTHAKPSLRPRTYVSYEGTVRLHIKPYLGDIRLTQLSPLKVQSWLTERQEAKTPARTLRYARTVLRAALNRAMKQQLITRNAAVPVDVPRHTTREMQPLTEEQARAFLKEADTHPLGTLFTIAVACGLRIGEGLALKWPDVDFEQGTLTVRRTIARVPLAAVPTMPADGSGEPAPMDVPSDKPRKSALVLGEPKSRQSRRTLKLPATVVSSLKTHRVKQLEARLKAGEAWADQGFIFTTSIGTPVDYANARKDFKGLLTAAKLPTTIRIHDCRHSAATFLLAAGVDPRTIQTILGHSQITLTLGLYSHTTAKLQEVAADAMDKALGHA